MKESAQNTTLDTMVSAPIGEAGKDVWAKRFREGDLEAGVNLARCYEMTGELAEGLIVINEVLRHDLPVELQSKALLRKAVLQIDSPAIAWNTIVKASVDVSPGMRGQLHNQRGRILKELRKFDSAILEYTEAAHYFRISKSSDLMGHACNNLAGLYRKQKMYPEAHESVDKAIRLWSNYEYLPHALDQKALIYIDQKEYTKAHGLARSALDRVTEQHRWKAEFLATLSKAQAGLGKFTDSMVTIEDALSICDYLNDENLRLQIFASRKASCEIMYQVSDQSATTLALKLSGGQVRQAAKKLGINHFALSKSIKKHSLKSQMAQQ